MNSNTFLDNFQIPVFNGKTYGELSKLMDERKLVAVSSTDSIVTKINSISLKHKQFRYNLPRYSDIVRNIRINLIDTYNRNVNEQYLNEVHLLTHGGQLITKNLHEYVNIIPLVCFREPEIDIILHFKNVDDNLMNCQIHTSYDMIHCNLEYRKNLAHNNFIMDNKIKIIDGRLGI